MKNILLLLDVWMQIIHTLKSYKPCIIYNSNIPTYSFHILLLQLTQFVCTTHHLLKATVCLDILYCLCEMILPENRNSQQLKYIGVTVL